METITSNRSLNLFLLSLVVSTVLTGGSYLIAMYFGWITELNLLEMFSVFTSYSCTFLCVKQSRWNYPIGIVSVVALMILFYQQNLLGSAALQLYLIPTLVYGYFIWGKDTNTKPVEHLDPRMIPIYMVFTVIAYFVSLYIANYFGASLATIDIALLIMSIFAQFLLDRKKIETWFVWAIVNIISIGFYFSAGLPLVALQFVLFLANVVYGYIEWNKGLKKNEYDGRAEPIGSV